MTTFHILGKRQITLFKHRDFGISKEGFGFLIIIDHHIVITLRGREREREFSSVSNNLIYRTWFDTLYLKMPSENF